MRVRANSRGDSGAMKSRRKWKIISSALEEEYIQPPRFREAKAAATSSRNSNSSGATIKTSQTHKSLQGNASTSHPSTSSLKSTIASTCKKSSDTAVRKKTAWQGHRNTFGYSRFEKSLKHYLLCFFFAPTNPSARNFGYTPTALCPVAVTYSATQKHTVWVGAGEDGGLCERVLAKGKFRQGHNRFPF